ncbi:ATP-binding cassette domain-containing protein [Curtobacterium sp. VKM Ac-2922]|uniref:ABC transporter ATP-binding protein n=1 Tax=Curtobacterium sp. VKM Ac-2922 TaxID=2929475 RepID=UPI001FB4F9EE|nr:ABC transporter ATP-binding protein [Curtobacterium sp. VKM Ac-2922]MCJ1712946.1 ABC transporter ATP-binding protein [Curtobacterium sp. VKM Ac-2922]
MFELADVSVRYPGVPDQVFSGVDLTLDEGTLMVLVGPNGAGKTTLLRAMCGLIRPTTGRIELDGCDVVRHPDRAQRSLGVSLYPERSFYFRLTARQNLRYFAALRGLGRRAAMSEVDRVLTVAGLEEHESLPFMRLSLGLRKRLGFARALLGAPSTLLLDEPLANLDAASSAAVVEHLASLRDAGHRVVLSTHEASGVASLVDVVGQLKDGRLTTTDERTALVLGKTVMVETEPTPPPTALVSGWSTTTYGFSQMIGADDDITPLLASLGTAGFRAVRVGTRQEASVLPVSEVLV